tara:strand:+ start:1747 stop:2454 length:708 start_codon:yes stop_codon:yes gene_type:complete
MSEEQQPSEVAQLMQIVQEQGQQIAALTEQLQGTNDRFEGFTDALDNSSSEDDYEIPNASEEELESMTNAQLANHLEGRLGMAIQNAVGAAMEPVSDDLAATQQFMQNNNVNSEINQMSQRYPDFQPLANDIADIIQDRSNNGYSISMEDAYRLARAGNPDTVAAVEKASSPEQPNLAGGLLPTSRMIGEQNTRQDMDIDEALGKAFQEEVTDQGLNPLFDDSGISVVETPDESA